MGGLISMHVCKPLTKLEVRKYLESWYRNVNTGDDVESEVVEALNDKNSLVEWFNTPIVSFDDEYAISVAKTLHEEWTKK